VVEISHNISAFETAIKNIRQQVVCEKDDTNSTVCPLLGDLLLPKNV
jgi:hypothetical protein